MIPPGELSIAPVADERLGRVTDRAESGDDRRKVFDGRFAGTLNNWDWDLEAMGQTGNVGTKDVRAWAAGTRAGYTFASATWNPRMGIQLDAASGDRHPGDNVLGTF